VDIPIVFSGIRPGEKFFEEILGAEEGTEATQYEKIFVARNSRENDAAELLRKIDSLIEMSSRKDGGNNRAEEIITMFKEIVPTYTPRKID